MELWRANVAPRGAKKSSKNPKMHQYGPRGSPEGAQVEPRCPMRAKRRPTGHPRGYPL